MLGFRLPSAKSYNFMQIAVLGFEWIYWCLIYSFLIQEFPILPVSGQYVPDNPIPQELDVFYTAAKGTIPVEIFYL